MAKDRSKPKGKSIYVWPSGHGWAFLCGIFFMLLTGATYDNNLVYFLAFFLFSMVLVSAVHAYRNLRGVEVQLLTAADTEAGQPAPLEFQLQGGGVPHESLELDVVDKAWRTKRTRLAGLGSQDIEKAVLVLKAQKRGRYRVPAVYLQTRYPLGLFVARRQLKFERPLYFYPEAKGQALQSMQYFEGESTKLTVTGSDGSDFYEHRDYQKGDPMSRVDWKVYARSGDLLVKSHRAPSRQILTFRWDRTPGADVEAKLSQLSLWLNEAQKKEAQYELVLPHRRLHQGEGQRHYQECQRALSTFEKGGS